MKFAKLAIATVAGASCALATAADDSWNRWERLSRERCPSHHVELICGDCYLFLVEDFDATLSKGQQSEVARIADTERKCAGEWGGFSCEASRSFLAYDRLGLMPRFVRYGCLRIKCQEAAICTRVPNS